MWRQDRQLADLLSLHRATEVGGMIRHPELGMISPTNCPWQNSRTTELSETTMPTVLVTALMFAAAM